MISTPGTPLPAKPIHLLSSYVGSYRFGFQGRDTFVDKFALAKLQIVLERQALCKVWVVI